MANYYYRNRRLGEFLKELSLTEGRNTGIPTIQQELAHNGSPAATFETDEDRLSFLVRIPCHKGEEGISTVLLNDKDNAKEDKNDSISRENDHVNDHVSDPVNRENDPLNRENDPVNEKRDLVKNLLSIYNIVSASPEVTYTEIAEQLNISVATVKRNLQKLKEQNYVKREGSDKTGKWVILK